MRACCLLPLLLSVPFLATADEVTLAVGKGSYALQLPSGAKFPQEEIFATENVPGKMPTNDWWSSAAWLKFSERMYPHPLAVQAETGGLRIYYPGANITANNAAIFGFMPDKTGDDVILGHSEIDPFDAALVDGFSDWFVSLKFVSKEKTKSLRTTFGHGSPFVYAIIEGGSPTITCTAVPKVWSGDANSAVLAITLGNKHYALFGPSGSTWNGIGTKTLTNNSKKRYFSLAVLPNNDPKVLEIFQRYAYSHVTNTQVVWEYDQATAEVHTDYTFTTEAQEGEEQGTLFALYPHQWRNTKLELTPHSYSSVRGTMKLGSGTKFRTTMKFPGVLPCLPKVEKLDDSKFATDLRVALPVTASPVKDTYWEGKELGKYAAIAAMADVYGVDSEAPRKLIRQKLETWLTASSNQKAENQTPKSSGLFVYNQRWGTLIGYPASYGSDVELNDHHFHYGYFIRAAAEVAMSDSDWAQDENYGGMIKRLIRDIASTDRHDKLFPFLRNFDPYAGHTWASGHAKFGDGNNNESSSEAMNAWYGLILWGEATGDRATRDLGIYLYTTEMNAIQEYWFDIRNENHPAEYSPSVVTMIWGGKGANGTWFSANPEMVHGINWLPITGGSLYLGHKPEYCKKNYEALGAENNGTQWDAWADLMVMYRALSDSEDALKQLKTLGEKDFEAGNSLANTYHWVYALREFGPADATITADDPLSAVFNKEGKRTYAVFNMQEKPKRVRFSDGKEVLSKGKGMTTTK